MLIYKPLHDMMVIDLLQKKLDIASYQDKIEIGYYSNCQVTATCGIATKINDIHLGLWVSPGDFGASRGRLGGLK